MSDLFTAAENIRRFAKQFEGIQQVADVLEGIGKLDQIAKEQEDQANKARKDANKAKDELADVTGKITEARDSAQSIKDAALLEGDRIVALAKRSAEEEAAGILKQAQDEAAKLVAQASTEKARLSSEIGGLQKAVIDARAELGRIEHERSDTQKEITALEGKLEVVRAKVQALLA